MTQTRTAFHLLVSTLVCASISFADDPHLAKRPDQQNPGLQIVAQHAGHTIRADKQADWPGYAALHFMPAVYQPVNPNHRLKPAEVQQITAQLDAGLSRAFHNSGAIAEPALDVKPVITDVKKSNVLLNVVSFALINTALSYGRTSVTYQFIDAATHRLVGEVENSDKARPWNIYPWQILSDFQPLGHTRILLHRDAKTLQKYVGKLLAQVPIQQGSLAALTSN